MPRLTAMFTSALPKNAQRKPLIRYTTGLSRLTACQNGGSMLMA